MDRSTADQSDGAGGLSSLRPLIASSWRRVLRVGLDPRTIRENLAETEFDPRSSLLCAAAPVLSVLQDQLAGTGFCVMLADRDCKIVHRWFDERATEGLIDDLGVRPGSTLREERIGTNALGTAFELRRGAFVHGAEHFAEPFKRFSCYGQPIRHPLTKRIEGVLDVTKVGRAANPLLAPLVARAVADIEQSLLDGTRSSERHLLAAFQAASSNRQRPIAAIGENVAFSNKAALDLLEPSDYALMRVLMAEPISATTASTPLSLASGEVVTVERIRVAGAGTGTLFHIDRAGPTPGRPAAAPPVGARTAMRTGRPVLISGPAGSGRTTAARELARCQPLVFLTATAALLEGEPAWAAEFRTMLRVTNGTLCVEGIDLLPDRLLTLVIESLKTVDRAELILTAAPFDDLTGLARTLASLCVERIDLAPLRNRSTEIPDLAMKAVSRIRPDAQVRLAPGTIQALSAQPWPGNFHELTMVMTHAIAHRAVGDIAVADLPEAYRCPAPDKQLAGLERAERDAIVRALAECDGNKVKAAHALGVSRTTLYARIRSLRIPVA